MKYKTFALLRKIALIILFIALFIWLLSSVCGKSKKRAINSINNTTTQSSEAVKPAYGSDELPVSKIDKEIFGYQKSDISTGKIDDQGDSYKKFINTSSYKVDLRCDFKKGYSYWNRIKVDLNNDGNWDEKWTYQKNGQIRKEVSPDDNEKYEYKYFLKNEVWVKK